MRTKSNTSVRYAACALLAPSIGTLLGLLGTGSPASAGSCQGEWWTPPWSPRSGFFATGLNDDGPRTFAGYDPDGPGPLPRSLYAGGFFHEAPGGVPALTIARYSGGSAWTPVGPGLTDVGHPGAVNDMVVFDLDGPGPQRESLVVGGRFDMAGGILVNNIARWDGAAWHAIGGGITGVCVCSPTVYALAIYDTDGVGPLPERLVAAGRFSGLPPDHLRVWTGATWQLLAGGLDQRAVNLALLDFDGPGPQPVSLVVAGEFLTVGGSATPVLAPRVARWDGSAWHGLALGPPFIPNSIETFDLDGDGPAPARLIVGGPGDFLPPAGPRALYWDESTWQPLDASMTVGVVRDFHVFDTDGTGPTPPQLFAAGSLGSPPNQHRLVRWTGTAWQEFEGGADQQVYAVSSYDFDDDGPLPPHLIIGGEFASVGGANGADKVFSSTFARWGCFEVKVECPADLDGSGSVTGIDLAVLLGQWSGAATYAPCPPYRTADLNHDCKVDGLDLAMLLATWGPCP